MSLSFKNRERIIRLFEVVNSPLVILGGIGVALAGLLMAVWLGWWITAGLCLASAVIDILRMRWLRKRGLWGRVR